MNTATDSLANPTERAGSRLYPWVIWGLAALFYFYEVFLKVSPGVMVPELQRAFAVSAAALGNLSAMYFYIYSFMQVPVGIMLDRFGPRILISLACCTCAFGSFLFAYAESLSTAMVGRFFIGLGAAFAPVGCMKVAANWFPPNRFALLVGLMVTIGFTGAIAAETPLALMVEAFNWRNSLFIFAAIGAVLAIIIWMTVRDNPKGTSTIACNKSNVEYVSLLTGLTAALKNPQTWIVSLYGGLMFTPTEIMGQWGVSFLQQNYSIGRPAAGGLVSFLFIGWMVSSPLWGAFSDRIGRRLPPMIIGNIGALLVTLIILYTKVNLLWMDVLLFLFGFFSGGFLPAFSIIREINPPAYTATALGFINTLNMLLPAASIPLVGYLLDSVWKHTMLHGAPAYTVGNFHYALSVLPICFGIGLLTLPFIKETYCKVQR